MGLPTRASYAARLPLRPPRVGPPDRVLHAHPAINLSRMTAQRPYGGCASRQHDRAGRPRLSPTRIISPASQGSTVSAASGVFGKRRGEKRDWLRGWPSTNGRPTTEPVARHGPRRRADCGSLRRNDVRVGRIETVPAVSSCSTYPPRRRSPPAALARSTRSVGGSRGRIRVPLELSPLVDPSVSLLEQMTDGRLDGIVLKHRTSTYRDGTRVGWVEGQGPQLVRA
jgi:hypothetical protein